MPHNIKSDIIIFSIVISVNVFKSDETCQQRLAHPEQSASISIADWLIFPQWHQQILCSPCWLDRRNDKSHSSYLNPRHTNTTKSTRLTYNYSSTKQKIHNKAANSVRSICRIRLAGDDIGRDVIYILLIWLVTLHFTQLFWVLYG